MTTCPLCHGRGLVSPEKRAAYQARLAQPWENILGGMALAVLVLVFAWLGVRAWDREAALAEQQAREFYGEVRR